MDSLDSASVSTRTAARQLDSTASAILSLERALLDTLREDPLFPGFSGYCGWNYECATLIYAVLWDEKLGLASFFWNGNNEPNEAVVDRFLETAQTFPYPGSHPFLGPWLYAPGDRMGLFGSLYFDRRPEDGSAAAAAADDDDQAQRIAAAVELRLRLWSRSNGCFIRTVGWGFLWGFSLFPKWIWADDAFIGGFPLLYFDANGLGEMLLQYDAVLRDKTDNLYWHGARLVGLET